MPKNRRKSRLLRGVGNSSMAATLAAIGLTKPWPTCFPRYVTTALPISHLARFKVNLLTSAPPYWESQLKMTNLKW